MLEEADLGRSALLGSRVSTPGGGQREETMESLRPWRRGAVRGAAALFILAACEVGRHFGPTPHLEPALVDFGIVVVGAPAPPARSVFLVNGYGWTPDTYAPFRVQAVTIQGPDLAVVANSCDGALLSQAAMCVIDVAWTPLAAYTLDGRLDVETDAGAVTARLRGTSVAAGGASGLH